MYFSRIQAYNRCRMVHGIGASSTMHQPQHTHITNKTSNTWHTQHTAKTQIWIKIWEYKQYTDRPTDRPTDRQIEAMHATNTLQ